MVTHEVGLAFRVWDQQPTLDWTGKSLESSRWVQLYCYQCSEIKKKHLLVCCYKFISATWLDCHLPSIGWITKHLVVLACDWTTTLGKPSWDKFRINSSSPPIPCSYWEWD
jgi:hypothetical protein